MNRETELEPTPLYEYYRQGMTFVTPNLRTAWGRSTDGEPEVIAYI